MPVKIFFCYAHEDEDLLNKLKRHLWPLQRQGLIAVWHDREILPGENWEQTIDLHLSTADLFLLLISPDFMASDYCFGKEMQQALARHKAGTCRVVPILLRPTFWEDAPFRDIQLLPTDARPITLWPDRDLAYQNVVTEISRIIKDLPISLQTKEEGLKEVLPDEDVALRDLKRYEQSLALYQDLIMHHWNDAFSHTQKGVALNGLRRYQEALDAFETAILIDSRYAHAYFGKGDTLLSLKRYEEALAAYEQAIRLDPNFHPALSSISVVLIRLKRFKEALSACEQDVRLFPNSAVTHNNKGVALNGLRRYQEALPAFEYAIRLDPKLANAYRGKGDTLHGLKRYEEALAAYEQAIRLDPYYVDAYKGKSNALHSLKRHQEAKQAYEKAHLIEYESQYKTRSL
jgi:tetratricopeptide (TPR) repeat protein